jgi:hypothetical protein
VKQSASIAESAASLANTSTVTIDIGGAGLKASVLDRVVRLTSSSGGTQSARPC